MPKAANLLTKLTSECLIIQLAKPVTKRSKMLEKCADFGTIKKGILSVFLFVFSKINTQMDGIETEIPGNCLNQIWLHFFLLSDIKKSKKAKGSFLALYIIKWGRIIHAPGRVESYFDK